MLGARIDLIQPQIRNLIVYLLPLPDKKNDADWTEPIVKHDRVCSTSYQKRFNKVLYFVVMGASEDVASHDYAVYAIMSV